jgi:hypothetical protein
MGRAFSMRRNGENIGVWWEYHVERERWEDLYIYWRIILKWMLEKQDGLHELD